MHFCLDRQSSLKCFLCVLWVPKVEGKKPTSNYWGRSWPVVDSGQQMPGWSWPWQQPGTGQLSSSQTCCAPGATPQLGQCFPCKAMGATAHPKSSTPGGTTEVGQRSSSDKALLLLQLLKLPGTFQSSSSAVSCYPHYSNWKTGSCFLVFPENTAMCCYDGSRPFANASLVDPPGKKVLFIIPFGHAVVCPSGNFTVQFTAGKSYKGHTNTQVSIGGKFWHFCGVSIHSRWEKNSLDIVLGNCL